MIIKIQLTNLFVEDIPPFRSSIISVDITSKEPMTMSSLAGMIAIGILGILMIVTVLKGGGGG
jgi:hypothetical protein